jgi:hypothetical protein
MNVMNSAGWIKFPRDIFAHPVWIALTESQKLLFLKIVCAAEWEEREWVCRRCGASGILHPGEFTTTIRDMAKKFSVEKTKLERIFAKLIKNRAIVKTAIGRCHCIYTIRIWDIFSDSETSPKKSIVCPGTKPETKPETNPETEKPFFLNDPHNLDAPKNKEERIKNKERKKANASNDLAEKSRAIRSPDSLRECEQSSRIVCSPNEAEGLVLLAMEDDNADVDYASSGKISNTGRSPKRQRRKIDAAGISSRNGEKEANEVLKDYYNQYKQLHDIAPQISWNGKDRTIAKQLLGEPDPLTAPEIHALVARYLALTDQYIVRAGHPFSLMASVINRLLRAQTNGRDDADLQQGETWAIRRERKIEFPPIEEGEFF